MKSISKIIDNAYGGIAGPVILYVLGVPGFLCILAWLFFFKGK